MNTANDREPQDGRREARALRVLEGGSATAAGRALPYSLEAEEYLLACCLIDGPAVLAKCAMVRLAPAHFYDPKHGVIFEVLLDLFRRNLPIAPDTLAEELKTRRQLDAVGGYAFVTQVASRVPTTAQAGYFLQKVFEQAMLRALIREASAVVEDCHAFHGQPIGELYGRWASIAQRHADFVLRAGRTASQAELVREALAAATNPVDPARWLDVAGLPHATAAFGHFDVRQEHWLNLIAAPPSRGKSTLLRQHVGHQLVAGKRALVFLLETSARMWLQGLAAMFAHVELRELLKDPPGYRKLWPEKAKNFDLWMQRIETWMETQLWVYDDLFFLEDIERQVRELNRRLREQAIAAGTPEAEARGLDLVAGDYLQLVATRREFRGKREEQVAYMARTLKLLHKGLDVPGFWCVQLNRRSVDEGRRPRLSDLRESGALEQDADCVLFVHTPAENKAGITQDGNAPEDEVELIQAKRRNGPRDVAVDLIFHKRFGRYDSAGVGREARPGAPKPVSGYKRKEGAP